MNRRLGLQPKRKPDDLGFTLVELLVVIVIIAILIGLLVPAVGAVRRVAREAASKAVLTSLETGLETFKADAKLGGLYPPSHSDWFGEQGARAVISPYTGLETSISGAGLLVWALSGADLLGTAGFKPVGGAPTWGACTSSAYNSNDPTSSGLYALYPSNHQTMANQPVHSRFGPYVDISKLKVTRNEGTADQPDFVIPEERKAVGANAPARQYPMYLDAFGYPVLYWRADPAGRQMADAICGNPNPQQRGIYRLLDNPVQADPALWQPIICAGGAEPELRLSRAGEYNKLGWGGGTYIPLSPPPRGTFQHYIRNQATQAKLEPSRPDSYLLVSPGYDGVYGTGDDITNFEHHGL